MTERTAFDVHSHTRNSQRPLWKEVDIMTDKEQANMLIDTYANLQRIISADDWRQEVNYQISLAKAKLESMGIVTENLDIHRT